MPAMQQAAQGIASACHAQHHGTVHNDALGASLVSTVSQAL